MLAPRYRAAMACLLFGTAAVAQPPAVPSRAGDPAEKATGKEKEDEKGTDAAPEWYNVHGQTTVIPQGNLPFPSPYQETFSLDPSRKYRTTATATLNLAARAFPGREIIFNPESPVNGSVGFGGFPNGEATRTGVPQPTPHIARLLWKQTIGPGGEQEMIEEGPNVLGGMADVHRITIRAGNMFAGDLFDDNAYSHDPRTQFMNWGLMYNGAWDYPANVRGYTYGGGIEWNRTDWAFRYGLFAEPAVANGAAFDPQVLRANANTFEVERRYKLAGPA